MHASLVLLLLLNLLAPPAMAARQDDLFARARQHYQFAKSHGHITATIQFEQNHDEKLASSPGYAIPDFPGGRCKVFLNPKAIHAAKFDSPFDFRFMIYHEMAHCELYFKPHALAPFPELNPVANLLLSDLVQIEYLHKSASKRINGYNVYHETYADIKALGMLSAEGAASRDIARIIAWRTETGARAVLDTHNTGEAIKDVLLLDGKKLSAETIDRLARNLADRHIVNSFIRKTLNSIGGAPSSALVFEASSMLGGALRMPLSDLNFQWATARDREFITKRLRDVSDSPNAIWLVYAAAVKRHREPEAVINEFFMVRYGMTPSQMRMTDQVIAAELALQDD